MRGIRKAPGARMLGAVLIVALLAGCGSRPGAGSLMAAHDPAPGAREHTVLIATTRQRDNTPGTFFNGERDSKVNYAEATISVPPSHESGKIEWPPAPPGDPNKHFVLRSAAHLDGPDGFKAALRRELSTRPKGERQVFFFVHGYNTRFPEALFRFVQLADDSRNKAVPVLFTWASRGSVTDYVYDTNSATAARDGLEKTIRLAIDAGAEKVNILAHSMGNWLLVETIRQIRISGRPLPQNRIGLIALAAPDLDIDVFKAQLRTIGKLDKPFFIIVSKDDRALRASRMIAGGKERVGDYGNEEELAALGAVVIDLTELKAQDAAHHGKFAQLAQVAPQLRQALERGVGAPAETDHIHSLGSGVGQVVGGTAEAVVTLPLTILTAPIQILSGGG